MKQDVIRAWAKERKLPIGARGRLPQTVLDAYRKETGRTTQASPPSDQEPESETPINAYEPLADYLEPRFGNIYDGENSIVPYVDRNGWRVQTWTDAVRAAIREYLLQVAPEPLLRQAFPDYMGERTEAWADSLLDTFPEPWEVAYWLHETAVTSVPTLEALIGGLQAWPELPEDVRADVTDWLEEHATRDQLRRIPDAAGQNDPAFYLPHALEPPALLKVWDDLTGSAPSDLTDAEWQLIEPLMPTGTEHAHYARARAAINGMLYKAQTGCNWMNVPIRYGTWTAVYTRHRNYTRKGTFGRMVTALQGHPGGAARIITWLRGELGQ